MANTSTTVLVGVEDTKPQTRPFNSVRELDEDEEGDDLIDIDVNDDNTAAAAAAAAENDDHNEYYSNDDSHLEMTPLLLAETNDNVRGPSSPPSSSAAATSTTPSRQMRSRRQKPGGGGSDTDQGVVEDQHKSPQQRSCLKRKESRDGLNKYGMIDGGNGGGGSGGPNQLLDGSGHSTTASETSSQQGGGGGSTSSTTTTTTTSAMGKFCRESSTQILRTTVTLMNFLSRILLWGSFIATSVGVVWYSRELKINGTDGHLIAWFSAGAFVLLGFPISMCGIIMHLRNYYQPNVQCYVVRILWMVPIYSIESWLCLRFHTLAIYIETLRDCYESYVLYSFFQFLIEVLGGEEALVLMLKDKSPTRGAHIWGLGYCMKPWVMGQPLSRRMSYTSDSKSKHHVGMGYAPEKNKHVGMGTAFLSNVPNGGPSSPMPSPRPIKRVQWTSPFFVKCKFGVLQYVLLKFVSAIFVMVLEMYGLYKEGDFTPRGGYLYICILANLSQCWALYCLVFFYYALKNELGPIRPVGKFLSVKALVFFTWWQSLAISIMFQMGMIPHYTSFDNDREWTSEAVAKGLQDWLICIEMFCAAIVHTFVFPHTDYLEPLGIVEQRAGNHMTNGTRRLGRKGRHGYRRGDDKSACSKSSGGDEGGGVGFDLELGSGDSSSMAIHQGGGHHHRPQLLNKDVCSTVEESDKESTGSGTTGVSESNPRPQKRQQGQRQGFVRALLDSTLPRDVLDESVGIFKGEFNVEKKTLLHHAATSDEYDLFSQSSKRRKAKLRSTQCITAPATRKIKEKEARPVRVPDSVQLNEKLS
mmetsp:Transcript_26049/g.47219  ORF Transcript_26049/g.47219 Transcript_26049/m.47219 type:complete len:810 (+) Transcript_26049:230-2659(+)